MKTEMKYSPKSSYVNNLDIYSEFRFSELYLLEPNCIEFLRLVFGGKTVPYLPASAITIFCVILIVMFGFKNPP